ncbi:MAG TPA: peptidoglycan DD-metalloendopeptidase family protein [Roseiarcus sp.]|nr:peptidoglycan DD-metalloendopeptidase family protein [Roseiarcus sp.]
MRRLLGQWVIAVGPFLAQPLPAGADPAGAGPAAPAPSVPAPQTDEKEMHEMELRGVQDTLRASDEQRRRIEADIEGLRADHARLNAALIETTAKVKDNERQMAAANERLTTLTESEKALKKSLENRRGVIADVLAVLQRMGRNPPPAILVKPQDMAQAIRAAIVLGAVIPELKSQTLELAQDLEDLANLRQTIVSQREQLGKSAAALSEDRARLSVLIEARQQSLSEAQGALDAERDRAAELARQASNLRDLIARMENEAGAAAQAAAADIKNRAAAARSKDPAALKPALAFADAKGALDLPVAGVIVKTFGAPDGYGGAERGISIATPPAATVSAPTDGRVVFSGPYRTYGQLLILNAGGGYYVVLAGMDRISVSVGQFVLAGEPVAAMGDGTARTAIAAAIGAAQPVLYIEFRKDGMAVDPQPWWAKADLEKARG